MVVLKLTLRLKLRPNHNKTKYQRQNQLETFLDPDAKNPMNSPTNSSSINQIQKRKQKRQQVMALKGKLVRGVVQKKTHISVHSSIHVD